MKALNSALGEKYPSLNQISAKLLAPKNAYVAVWFVVVLSQDDGTSSVWKMPIKTSATTSAG